MSLLSLILSLLPNSKGDNLTPRPPLDIEREILSIAAVENSAGKVGEHGERGRLQFLPTRWYQFSAKPHRWAGWRHPFAIAETERVERAHIQDLIETCHKMRLIPTPYLIALLHTAGATAVIRQEVPAMKKDFAARVEAVYDSTN